MKYLFSLLLLMTSFSTMAAEKLQLELSIYLNDKLVKESVAEVTANEEFSVIEKEVVQFNVTPNIVDNMVELTGTLQKFENGAYQKIADPQLLVPLNEQAVIEVGTEDVQLYKVEVTTRLL